MKLYKSKNKLKNSREVFKFFTEKKIDKGLIKYKGGIGVVKDKRVEQIFVGAQALKNAKKVK